MMSVQEFAAAGKGVRFYLNCCLSLSSGRGGTDWRGELEQASASSRFPPSKAAPLNEAVRALMAVARFRGSSP